MVQKILSYSINFVLIFLLSMPLQAQDQRDMASQRKSKKEKKEKDEDIPQYPLYNGISVGLDLWGIGGKVVGGDNLSTEVAVDVNLKNRFFPIAEIGFTNSRVEGDKGIKYKTNAPYFRLGMDYNAFYKKKHGHMLMVGARYGMSSFKYDIETLGVNDPIFGGSVGNPNLEDGIWGGSLPYHQQGMKATMHWLEICLGIRAHIFKNLYMGWALRMKYKLSASVGKYGDPFQVPGFGKYGSNSMGVTYTITYKLPF